MSWEEQKSDLITTVLAIIYKHTHSFEPADPDLLFKKKELFVPSSVYPKMISDIEDLR